MSKPILRVAKMKRYGKTCPQAVDNHLSRATETDNADPSRSAENRWIVGGPGTLADRINGVLEKAGIFTADLRRDATIANDVLLTISPDFFRPSDPDAAGVWEQEKLEIFEREAIAFLKQQFGPRLAAAVLHLDESTPHIQAVVVPVMKDPKGGHRLSGKAYFDPVRLESLQEAWEKRLRPHGVDPRTKGSTARHTTIKAYYSGLEAAPEVLPPSPPSPPPLRALLPGGSDAMAAWQAKEVKKAAKRQKPLAQAVAKGMLYEAEKVSGNTLRRQLGEQGERLARMREDLAKASSDLVLTKDQVAVLRGVPVAEVAEALGYAGEVGRRENALDLVKRLGGLNFEEATRWMAVAFGSAAAGAAVRQQPKPTPEDVPLTKADQAKAVIVRQQLAALDAPAYRLTVQHTRANGEGYGVNLGRSKDSDEERTWSAKEVVALIPRLTAENVRGGQVYVTPLDARVHHALVDDLSGDDLATLQAQGYAPATVIETSPGNHQAVVKILAKDAPAAAVNEWFKSINRELGDERITGLRHPMRLVGFQNRKPKYAQEDGRYPFVRLVEATRTFCAHAKAVVVGMAEAMTRAAEPTIPASGAERG